MKSMQLLLLCQCEHLEKADMRITFFAKLDVLRTRTEKLSAAAGKEMVG